jgi:hypothetical protein
MLKTAYTAYFDASGTATEPAITMSGFVSDVERWRRFEIKWQKLLAKESIDVFHMTDFVARKPPFDRWTKDASGEAKRDQFFRSLLDVLFGQTIFSFAEMVPTCEYESANRAYQVNEWFGCPYAFAGLGCLLKVMQWVRRNNVQRLQVFIEKGDEGQGILDRILQKVLKIDANFKSKAEIVPFQAADIAAWEGSKFVKIAQRAGGDFGGLRRSFLALDSHPNDWGAVVREDIIKTCKNLKVPRRA